MTQASRQAATLGGSADDTETAFYAALQHGDIDKLMDCWADEDDIVCVHPGGPRLIGAGAIRASFEKMFAGGVIRATPERVRKVASLVSAVHSVVERIEVLTPGGTRLGFVQATNVYHKTAHGWRLVAHHASPAQPGELQEPTGAPQPLH